MLKTVSSVANALGALNYKGTWNASTNTPALASGVGTKGDYYVVSVDGATDLDGITNWGVGDWATFNGSVWQRVEGGADGNFVNLDVTGTATMGGLVVDGAKDSTNVTITAPLNTVGGGNLADYSQVLFDNSQVVGSSGQAYLRHYANSHNDQESALAFGVTTTTGTTHEALRIDGGGDVSFFDPTGTTPKFFWDSSAESLGIGTSSPSSEIDIQNINSPQIRITDTGGNVTTKVMSDTTVGFVGTQTNHPLSFLVNNLEKMRITSAGNVGINDSNPSNKLTVNSTSGAGIKVYGADQAYSRIAIDNLNGQEWNLVAGVAGASNTGFGIYDVDAGAIRLQIDASGNVGIGTDSPGSKVTISDPGTGIGLINAASGNFNIGLLAGTGSPNAYIFQRANAPLLFGTNNAERARLTGDGNFLVGTTDAAVGVGNTGTGLSLANSGYAAFSRTGSSTQSTLFLNKNSNDGSILNFAKDGTSVGSIGTVAGDVYIGSGDTGIRFHDGTDSIFPVTAATGADRGSTVNLGHSTNAFKDLYLSGGVVFGTTGGSVSSKTLDDYEEGTWTPTVSSGITSPTYAVQTGRYTKIGNRVFYDLFIQTTGGTANSSHVIFSGLPFSGAANTGSASIAFSNSGFRSTNEPTNFFASGTTLETYEATGSTLIGTELGSAEFDLRMSGTYMV